MKLGALLCLMGVLPLLAPADGVYNFSSAPTTTDSSNLSFGFEFQTNAAITVTSLGYFDSTGQGFSSGHDVGIFDSFGNLLISTVLSSGQDEALDGQFRFQAVTPTLLSAGQTYVIAATSGGAADSFAYGDSDSSLQNFTVDPRITIAPDASLYTYQADDLLSDPGSHFAYTLYAGPNFEISPQSLVTQSATTPEPSTVFLMCTAGFAALLAGSFKRLSLKSKVEAHTRSLLNEG